MDEPHVLVWDAKDFGLDRDEVVANYASLEDAKRQAEHDLAHGRHPLRIEYAGKTVWDVSEGEAVDHRDPAASPERRAILIDRGVLPPES